MSLYPSPGKEDYTHHTSCTCTSNVRAHVGGRFGQRSRLVAAHFALY